MSAPVVASELMQIPDGFQVLDFSASSTIADAWSGTVPADARSFIIQPIGADLEWRGDGNTVVTGSAFVITDGSMMVFENQKNFISDVEFLGGTTVMVNVFG